MASCWSVKLSELATATRNYLLSTFHSIPLLQNPIVFDLGDRQNHCQATGINILKHQDFTGPTASS